MRLLIFLLIVSSALAKFNPFTLGEFRKDEDMDMLSLSTPYAHHAAHTSAWGGNSAT
jgi:hypothetical protein